MIYNFSVATEMVLEGACKHMKSKGFSESISANTIKLLKCARHYSTCWEDSRE